LCQKPRKKRGQKLPFESLNKLEEKGLITQGRRSKSVCLTEEGINRAEELKKKYKMT